MFLKFNDSVYGAQSRLLNAGQVKDALLAANLQHKAEQVKQAEDTKPFDFSRALRPRGHPLPVQSPSATSIRRKRTVPQSAGRLCSPCRLQSWKP
jgi:hypothetical protein